MNTRSKVLVALLVSLFCASAVSAQNWDVSRGQQMVRLAWSAYCPPQDVFSWNCYWCKFSGTPKLSIVNTIVDGPTNTMAYVGYDSSNIYVVFRGTTNLKNVLIDLAFFKKPIWDDMPDAKVHSGFRSSYLNLAPNVLLSIRTASLKCAACKHVVFTGHSLGAAVATIAAADYARTNPSLSFELFTLGSPRVGNSEFAAYVTKVVPLNTRWSHANDPVVHLPMKLQGFQHRVREIWEQGNNTNYKTCSTTNGEDPSCANSVMGVSLNMLATHSTYGGLYLHSGSCDTFARSLAALSDEDLNTIARAANEDLARLA